MPTYGVTVVEGAGSRVATAYDENGFVACEVRRADKVTRDPTSRSTTLTAPTAYRACVEALDGATKP